MGDARANTAATTMEDIVRELLDQVDSRAAAQDSAWAEKRDNARRSFRTACKIAHRSPDLASVLRLDGTTRDLSKGGLCFISRQHFIRKTPLGITVITPNGEMKHLTGQVAYCRQAQEGWYLTGVRFSPVDDEALAVAARPESVDDEATLVDPRPRPAPMQRSATSDSPASKHDQALAMLAAASASSMKSREMINRVLTLSMSSDTVVRRMAIPVLLQAPRRDAILALTPMLRDSNVSVQIDAIRALGQLHAHEAAGTLKELLRSGHDEVALSAAEALGRLGNQDGLRLVVRLLHSDEAINRRAARAVGVILGQRFSANSEGVASARRYLKAKGIR